MYKILTRLHTDQENAYRIHSVPLGGNQYFEMTFADEEEAKIAARELAKTIGLDDIRVVDEEDYYLQIIFNQLPDPAENTYVLTLVNDDTQFEGKVRIEWSVATDKESEPTDPEMRIENIKWDSTVLAGLHFKSDTGVKVLQWHMLVDGVPSGQDDTRWVQTFIRPGQNDGANVDFTFKNIQANHKIEIVIDNIKEPEIMSI